MSPDQQPVEPTEAYVITPIPARKRAIQAGALLLLGIGLITRVGYVGYQQGDAGVWIVGLIVAVPLFWWALKIWNRTETRSPTGAYIAIPLKKRLRLAGLYAAITVFVLWLTWHLGLGLPVTYAMLIFVLGGAFVVRELTDSKRFVLSSAAVLAKAQEEVELQQKRLMVQLRDEELIRKRWVRYPIAVGMLAVAGYFGLRGDPLLLGLSAFFGIGTAIFAWDAVLAIAGVGALVLLFYAFSALPVSVAVILGAGLISYVIYKTRKGA